jgi:hypothetical protein
MSLKRGGLPGKHEISGLFGYVTDEDRERWDKMRERNKKDVSTARHMMEKSAGAAHQLARYGIQARLNAETQVAARDRNNQNTTTRKQTRTITEETVDYEPRDTRQTLDGGPEF